MQHPFTSKNIMKLIFCAFSIQLASPMNNYSKVISTWECWGTGEKLVVTVSCLVKRYWVKCKEELAVFRWKEIYDRGKNQNIGFHDNQSNLKLSLIFSGMEPSNKWDFIAGELTERCKSDSNSELLFSDYNYLRAVDSD